MKTPFGSVTMKMPRRRRTGNQMKQQQQQRSEATILTTSTSSLNDDPTLVKTTTPKSSWVMGLSLGAGSFSEDGRTVSVSNSKPSSDSNLSVTSSITATSESISSSIHSDCSIISTITNNNNCNSPSSLPTQTNTTPFLRHSSSFLRVADLKMDPQHCFRKSSSSCYEFDGGEDSVMTAITTTTTSGIISSETDSVANFSYAAVDPPPGVDHDPLERWVALDNGAGSHAPIAPFAIEALARAGLESSLNESMWTPHAPHKLKHSPWHVATWRALERNAIQSSDLPPVGSPHEKAVVLWTGKFQHKCYGSELPAVRAAGILPVSPKQLFDLLVDSDRVKEYNKMSLGRHDLLVLQNNMQQSGPFGKSITKVMKSVSQPPILRQTMEFVSILHAKELEDGSGYLCVTRAVTQPEETVHQSGSSSSSSSGGALRSEILMGVNLIRRIEGDDNRCLMINVTHLRSPMVPMMIANRIGATAAANFIKDLRVAVGEA